jgi:hypothetical protein
MRTATLRSGTLRSIGGTPVGEFLLIPFGPVNVDRPISGRDYTFTRQHGRQAVAWFGRQQRKLAIDYEHQTLAGVGAHPEGLAPAAGWIGRLEIRADGLWAADVEWTDKARQLIAGGEYRYFSPVIYWTDKQYTELAGLGPVALTDDPATAAAGGESPPCQVFDDVQATPACAQAQDWRKRRYGQQQLDRSRPAARRRAGQVTAVCGHRELRRAGDRSHSGRAR